MLPVQGIEASNFGGLVRPGVLIQSIVPLILSMEGFCGGCDSVLFVEGMEPMDTGLDQPVLEQTPASREWVETLFASGHIDRRGRQAALDILHPPRRLAGLVVAAAADPRGGAVLDRGYLLFRGELAVDSSLGQVHHRGVGHRGVFGGRMATVS